MTLDDVIIQYVEIELKETKGSFNVNELAREVADTVIGLKNELQNISGETIGQHLDRMLNQLKEPDLPEEKLQVAHTAIRQRMLEYTDAVRGQSDEVIRERCSQIVEGMTTTTELSGEEVHLIGRLFEMAKADGHTNLTFAEVLELGYEKKLFEEAEDDPKLAAIFETFKERQRQRRS
jgi:hypothetical protein